MQAAHRQNVLALTATTGVLARSGTLVLQDFHTADTPRHGFVTVPSCPDSRTRIRSIRGERGRLAASRAGAGERAASPAAAATKMNAISLVFFWLDIDAHARCRDVI